MHVLMLADLSEPSSRALTAARALGARGHEVEVLAPDRGEPAGPPVSLVPEHPPVISSWDQVAGSLQRDLALLERGLRRAQEVAFDVLDARGWRAAYAAAGLREAFGLPIVASLDALRRIERRGRRWTRGDDLIEQTERWLASIAAAVVVRSGTAARAFPDGADVDVVAGTGAGERHAERLEGIYAKAIARARRPVHAVARA